ncbi:alpha-galactosidase [candidate division KSB1 bacterium]|nr:alpha-galactosidase [candidate division KSB1 bacterium]
MKITMLGAGSGFTQPLATDILHLNSITSGTFALVDIDGERLALARKLIEKIIQMMGKDWNVIASTDRTQVMGDSDYLINFIEVSGVDTVRYDNDIPLKYGISQCIGDTIGPGGIFKALRTVPPWLDILKDAEKLCPDALVLNYTNPMSIMTLAGIRSSCMPIIGLCHSVQGSSKQLAGYADIPYDELKWRCAGINHMAWFTELSHNGRDLYPELKENCLQSSLWEKDPVRFDMMRHFGYFVTESSGHFSEYVPYYRKRDELIDLYCREGYLGGRSFYANEWPTWRKNKDEKIARQLNGEEEIIIKRSHEYASIIIEAAETNQPAVVYGSVLNEGLVDNLPSNGVVEVACMIDRNGFNPCHFGSLPPQLAALCASNMAVYECTVEGILNKNKDAIYHALMLDPLSAAVASPKEIQLMADELFKAEREFLPDFV